MINSTIGSNGIRNGFATNSLPATANFGGSLRLVSASLRSPPKFAVAASAGVPADAPGDRLNSSATFESETSRTPNFTSCPFSAHRQPSIPPTLPVPIIRIFS